MKTLVILNQADGSVHFFYLGELVRKVIREMYKGDYEAWFVECMTKKPV